MEQLHSSLLDYGVLGIIALLSILGVAKVFNTNQAEKAALLELIKKKEDAYGEAVRKFTEASLETATALTELTAFLKTQSTIKN